MRQRTAEAARLESDYLERVRLALADRDEEERQEIVQAVQAHIEAALDEMAADPVGIAAMAQVIERLGPPEAYAEEATTQEPVSPPASSAAPGAAGAVPYAVKASRLEPGDLPAAVRVLDRVWWGALLSIVGLFIPIIDLNFCEIAGTLVIAGMLGREGRRLHPSLGTVATMERVIAGTLVLTSLVTVLAMVERTFAMLNLVVLLAYIVLTVVAYWWRQSIFAGWMDDIGRADVAATIRVRRTIDICVAFPLLTILGVILIAVTRSILAGTVMVLPLVWVTGCFLTLVPLARASEAARATIAGRK